MGEIVSFRSTGGTGEGYLARPDAPTGPGVVIIQGALGVAAHIRSLADRFAGAGFVAVAPHLPEGHSTEPPDRAGREITAAAAYLLANGATGPGVGCAGFGTGGSLALRSAAESEAIVAVVAFYPVEAADAPEPAWSGYAGKAALIHCAADGGTSTAPGVQATRSAIEAAGGECVLFDYPGTRVAFFNDDRPETYAPDASVAAWARTLDFFRNHLG